MNSVSDGLPTPGTAVAAANRVHRMVFASLGTLLALAAIVYLPTHASMIKIWLRSDTFVHGILILPICAWLVWRRWPSLRNVPVAPEWRGLLAILAMSILWWISDAAGIQVGAQFAAVGMIPALVFAIAGRRFVRAVAFPLGYLVFAVPFGEGAIPYLIDFTAAFTVKALQLTGFPVLREGAYFSIPAGNFEVAKACSGIRYLLASLALGTLYGYLIFGSLKKRVLFFLLALTLPIVANGLRAYGIVLIAHFSDMKLAVGVDHLIFGWIFFGIVMMLMFFVGDHFRDRSLSDHEIDRVDDIANDSTARPGGALITGLAAAVLLFAGPIYALATAGLAPDRGPASVPYSFGGWTIASAAGETDWYPHYVSASHEMQRRYDSTAGSVELSVVRYDSVTQGAELANPANRASNPQYWRQHESDARTVDLGGSVEDLVVREVVLWRDARTRLVWVWHEVDGRPVSGVVETKWRELVSLVRLRQPQAAAFLVSAPVDRDLDEVRERLERFVALGLERFRQCLFGTTMAANACLHSDAAGGPAGRGR